MGPPKADIGVFGGSGFYSFLDGMREHTVDTPYGPPSDRFAVGEIDGRSVAFLPRHGRHHQYPPHRVNHMTGYPEALLARELEICYVNVSLITDYDVGLEGAPGVEPVSHAEVVRVFEQNNAKLRDLLVALIPSIPTDRSCICSTALAGARFEV